MSDHRLSDIENLFRAVSGLPHSEQLAYLEMYCQDPAMKAEVLELLRYDRVEQGGLTHSSHEPSSTLEGAGSRIGPYKLLQKIGEGGMGVVYMAEQQEPVRRRVALKIIKLGMDTKQVVARFEAERQALAMMDHPNIARVLDAGTTDTGRPYFVMDLVQGVPITDFCEKNRLSTTARLLLFVQVCNAIQGAHHKGIIHRDIKPSNVLITLQHSEPTPVVIDFGIAKAINQSLTEKTYFTEYGAMIGTPAYMSPEQAEMSSIDVDTRTDVYSLGTLLYEMLTGTTPFPDKRLRSVGYAEMCRIITEETPERPSTRSRILAREAAATRQVRQRRSGHEHMISRDLDWISMKCLEKDRRRRYDTPNELVADIKRLLNNEPVTAAAPTLGYQLQKLYQRNQTASRLLIMFFFALLIGLAGVTWQWREAVGEREQKEQQRQRAVAEKQKAELAEQAARQKEAEARTALYASYIARADLELQRNKVATARDMLERCPEELRGWEWHALKSWTHGDLATLDGHTNAVFDVEYGPNGKLIASCGGGNPSWRSQGHESGPGEVIIWDAQIGERLHTITGHSHVIHAISFSPDGLTLASASQDGTVRLWDVISGKEKPGSPLALPDGATAVTFSSDGKYLAAGGFDGGCWIWSIDSLELVRQFKGTKAPVFGLAFTPDTATLIASAHDGIVYRARLMIWDVASGQARDVKEPEEVYGPAFALSPDGSAILIPQTKRFMIRGTRDGATHAYSGWCEGRVRGLAFDVTGSKVASCGDDGAIRIWNREQLGKESFHLFGHEGRVTTVAFSPTENRLASGGSDGKVKIWDLRRTAPEISDVPMTWLLWGYRFASVAFTPDSEHLTIIHSVGHALDVDIVTHTPSNYRKLDMQYAPESPRDIVEFSPDGAWVVGAAWGNPKIVKCWDRQTTMERVTLRGHQGKVDHVAVSTGAARIATASRAASHPDNTGEIKVWDGSRGKVLFEHEAKGLTATRIALSPNGARLAFASVEVDGEAPKFESTLADTHSHIRVYDISTGEEILHIADVPDVWQGLRFSPNGDRLAAAGANHRSILIWNFEQEQRVMTRHGVVKAADLAFSPDGGRIAVGSRTLTKVINAYTAEDLLILRTNWQLAPSDVTFQPYVCWSPDGRSLAVTSHDRKLSIWSIPHSSPRSLAELGQAAERRAVTHALQKAYIHHASLDNQSAHQLLEPIDGAKLGSAVEYWMRSRLYLQLGRIEEAKADFQQANSLGLNPSLLANKENLRPYFHSKPPPKFENDFQVPR